jgi:DNA-binding transcriptional ArsR family regulator
MYAEPSIAEVASLIGDPARANMLSALKDDGALTATELAHIAGVAPQTASGHLSKLMEARLIAVERQGRHRAVTDALQACGLLRPADGDFCLTGPGETFCAGFGIDPVGLAKGRRLFARQCLDWSERRPHLAGALGAALLEQFVARGWILRHRGGRAVEVTEAGHAGLKEAFAVDLGAG